MVKVLLNEMNVNSEDFQDESVAAMHPDVKLNPNISGKLLLIGFVVEYKACLAKLENRGREIVYSGKHLENTGTLLELLQEKCQPEDVRRAYEAENKSFLQPAFRTQDHSIGM
ncbi:Hypothetical predicted protein [Pelobates cultripes]|uniref:Uncharacterized protein n=1 Tax=Pelobates cultripes TaxID=61616 RepID=A0AAD1WB23_PELCU|nr:Hypothetical predicted protein [Pelobates cultripes]